MNTTENITKVQVVRTARNTAYRSVSDVAAGEVFDEPESGFPESITDSSQYESVQSIEARCMRGEIMLNNEPYYEFDGVDEITEAMLDGTPAENLDEGELDENIDQRAEIALSELSIGNEEQSDKSNKSEATTLPVENSGESEISGEKISGEIKIAAGD